MKKLKPHLQLGMGGVRFNLFDFVETPAFERVLLRLHPDVARGRIGATAAEAACGAAS